MPLTSPYNSSQQPHRHGRQSSDFHDQLDVFRDGEEVLTLSTTQQPLPDVAILECPGPSRSLNPFTHTGVDSPGWERLIRSRLATHERVSLVTTTLSNRDEVEAVRSLHGGDAQAFVDVMYETLDGLDHVSRMRCLRLLCKICGRNVLLPKSLDIPISYDRTGVPPYRGSFADVWKGVSQGQEVAVKELKLYQSSDQEKIRKGFCKEVAMWSALRHPNVLPLLGATMVGTQYVMVSEWMTNGNINEFVKAHPDTDRLRLLRDVGRGLDYLHDQELIHGDLKGANILVNRDGHACIADFSLLAIISDKENLISAISYLEGGTTRWTSPELLDPEPFGLKDSCQTKESDCYALGMVIYEVLAGRPPFSEYKDTVVIRKVTEGERPGRPQGEQAAWFTDGLWGMLELCWKPQPHDRPGLQALLQCLEGVMPPSPSPTTNEDAVTSTNDSLGSAAPNLGPPSISSKASNPTKLKTRRFNFGKPPLPSPDPAIIPSTPHTRHSLSASKIVPSIARPLTMVRTIQEFVNSSLTSEQLRQRAAPLLNNKELLRDVRGLTREDQKKFTDKVDQAYLTVDSQNAKLIIALGNVCSVTEQLPTSAVLSAGLEKRGNVSVASGGLTDIWRGVYSSTQVAIKAFRIYPAQNLKEAKEILWKRVPMWRRLSHENILPFRGVNMTLFQLALVYDWGHQGNISQYIASHPGASRPSLLFDVAKGLQYLHSLDIPHGDLKGANVVVDQRGRARLTEYGLAPINSGPSFTIGATPGTVGTSRCLAPEIIDPSRKGNNALVVESKPADVFAFAMFSVEAFTGKIPFEKQKNEAVALSIFRGSRPEMPENAQAVGITSEMWKLLEVCWQHNPKKRPTIEEVMRRWQKFIGHDYGNDVVTKKPQPTAEPTPGIDRPRAH